MLTVPSEHLTQSKEFKKQDNEKRPNNWKGKAMHGQYFRQIEDKNKINIWKWMSLVHSFRFSTQEQTLTENYVKFLIEKTTESHLSRMYEVES